MSTAAAGAERDSYIDWEAGYDVTGGVAEDEPRPVLLGVGTTFPGWRRQGLVVGSLLASAAVVTALVVFQSRGSAAGYVPTTLPVATPVERVALKELPRIEEGQPTAAAPAAARLAKTEPARAAEAPRPRAEAPRPRGAAAWAPTPKQAPVLPTLPALALAAELIDVEAAAAPSYTVLPVTLPIPPKPTGGDRAPRAPAVTSVQRAVSSADEPFASPFDVAPQVRNANRVQQALEREYPSSLRAWGVGGQAEMWFYINEQGVVDSFLLKKTSGNKLLDQAALRVAHAFEFSPGIRQDQPAPGWISLAIAFTGS
jgi:protein TonB